MLTGLATPEAGHHSNQQGEQSRRRQPLFITKIHNYMNTSKCSPSDMLIQHVNGLYAWLEDQICEANRLSIQGDDVHNKMRAWYRKCFPYLVNTMKGLAFTEIISLRFERNMIKPAFSHAVYSTDGQKLRDEFHLTKEEHEQLEQAEIDIIMRFTQEYNTIKERTPSRFKRTPEIKYFLKGITADELGRKFPREPKRGAGAEVIKIIKKEVQLGHIVNLNNMSEFHRSLRAAYGSVIPNNVQQLTRDLKK